MSVAKLPTMADMAALRAGKSFPKGKTRLEEKTAAKKLTTVDEKQFRTSVWTRDRKRCRCCGRKVLQTITRTAERGEVHHCHGRTGDLRFEVRSAILVCCSCHEKLSGKVNRHRLIVVATQTFTTKQGTFTDATFPIVFKEGA